MKILAVIPARGGSKGIPRKNLKIVAGKSLLGWSIIAAKGSHFQLRLVVSTDSPEIAAEAMKFGSEVFHRPTELSGDKASSESALLNVLEQLERSENYIPELVVFLQCTSPLTNSEDIDGAIQKLLNEEADSALTVSPFHYFLWSPQESGDWDGINHNKSFRPLRQERDPQYVETGAVYVMRCCGFRAAQHRFFGKTVAHITPAERHWEVDDPVDLEIAESLLRKGQNKELPFVPKAIIFDFDGVFTDNKVYLSQDGIESVRCDRGDGMGVELLRNEGMPMLILSKEVNPVVKARAKKLKVECLQGIDNKVPALTIWAGKKNLSLNECAYLGNDINDIGCMQSVGLPIATADAHPLAQKAAKIILKSKGGCGAVRELADALMAISKKI